MSYNDGIPVGALPVNSSNNGIPAITFTPGLADQTAEQKAAEYNSLIGRGFNDAQIRSAADTTFGTQSASDWDYLTNLARQVSAPNTAQVANTAGMGTQGIGLNLGAANLGGATQIVDQSSSGIGSLPIGSNVATTNNAANNVLGGVILAGDSWLSNPTNTQTIGSQIGQNVTNVAVGGSTTADTLNQLNTFMGSGGTFAPGTTVMLDIGGNDLLQGATPAEVKRNLDQIVGTLGAQGVNVVLSGAPAVGSVTDITGSTNLAMSSIFSDVAARNPNVKLVDAMSGLLNQKNLVDETGFHLNEAGRNAFNAALSNAFLGSQGAGPIKYSDEAIQEFVKTNNLTPEQATALAPYFGLSTDRVLDALSPTTKEQITQQFGVTEGAAPTTENILAGFKYANEAGLSEDRLKRTLGEDVFNTYKTGLADYAKTGIANILADDKLSFDEARTAVKFGRDYGYDAQKMADLTGTDKKVFDTIYKNYDDTTNKIVDSVLGAEDVKTNDDKIIRALALQDKFGFTDDDLAKAADFTPAQVKEFLDPVRNFGTDLNKILTNTDSTLAETKKLLETAKTNGAINQLYGAKLEPLDAKIAEIEDRWKGFKNVEPMHAQRVYDQIGGQREKLGNQYYRGVFGDPLVMAATLAEKGIDTLADIGQKDKYEAAPAEKRYTTKDGAPLEDLGNGTFATNDGSVVPKNQVKTVYGYTEQELREGPEGGYYESKFVPLSDKDVDKEGNYQKLVGKVAIDKDTGKEIADIDGRIASQNSSGGLRKKFNTLNVNFTKEGVPVITAASQRAGLGALVQDLAPIISMALPFVLPGLGSALSGMLPGAGVAASGATAAIAPTLMNQALTQGIISGGLTTLGGGQFEKGFLGGAVTPVINAGISSLLPAGMNPDLAKSLTSAGTGAVRGALQGGEFKDILAGGITQGLADYGVNAALGASGLTPQQLNFVTGIAAPLLQGKKINPITAFGALANAGQQTQRGSSNLDFGGGGDDIDALMGGGDVGGGDFYGSNESGSLGYNQPFEQYSLNNTFTGNRPSNFYGANMTGNSNDQSLIAQLGQIISKGAPLGGGYIKPARVGSGYGARWSKQFNEGGIVNADQQTQGEQP